MYDSQPVTCKGCVESGACELLPTAGKKRCPCATCLVKMVCYKPCVQYQKYMEIYFGPRMIGGDDK